MIMIDRQAVDAVSHACHRDKLNYKDKRYSYPGIGKLASSAGGHGSYLPHGDK